MKTTVSPELTQTFNDLAAQLVTPERYGAQVVLAKVIQIENYRSAHDEPVYYGD